MRVIAGRAKGTRLTAPPGLRVRPTLDRVRESLFNILGPNVEDARFLDLFAGTGANGIEALSRGAAECTFVDNHSRSLACIRRNLELTHLGEGGASVAVLQRLTLPQGIATLAASGNPYDLIFADPPYDFTQYDALLAQIHEHALLATTGLLVLEHAVKASPLHQTTGLRCYRRAEYGDTALSFFS